jgi:PTS system ascorbate-specific IIA component
MPLPPLDERAITIGADATDWRDAVRLAGSALADAGVALPGYADEMVRMIEEHGPYVVIAPGLALAHARPGRAVLKDGLAVVTLATPVPFGHPYNDPVHVVLALAITSPAGHLESVAAIANVFNDTNAVHDLIAARTKDDVLRILQ